MKLPRPTLSLVAGVLALGVWLVLGFVVPVGAGWPHLFLALGIALLVRRVVVGESGW
jgi:hypothetical protein